MDSDPSEEPAAGAEFSMALAGEAQRAEQEDLFEAVFGGTFPGKVLGWRYDAGPHGKSVTILGRVEGAGAVTGYACNPRKLGWSEEGVTIGQTGDVMTLEGHRGKGYFSKLDRRAMEEARGRGWAFAIGLPNRKSAHIFVNELGWEPVGVLEPWTFVLKAGAVARRERLREGRLAQLGAPLAMYRGMVERAMMRKALGDMVLEEVDRFGDWVESLGRVVATRYRFMVRRDAEYLNWRYFDSPNARFGAFRILTRGGKPVAYGVVQWPGEGSRVGYLVDAVAQDRAVQGAVVGTALDRLEQAGCEVVRAHAIRGSDWQVDLKRAGFRGPRRRRDPRDQKWVIVNTLGQEGHWAEVARDPKGWFFTDGDRDDELVR